MTDMQMANSLLLKTLLVSLPKVQQRIRDLEGNLESMHRDIVQMKHLPRVTVLDFKPNYDIMESLIFMDDDALLEDVFVVQRCFSLMDKDSSRRLSCQKSVELQNNWSRWESDKLRLLWSHFLRQLKRTDGANDFFCFRLKTLWCQREKAKGGSIVPRLIAMPPLCAAGSRGEGESGVLAMLPDFPVDFLPELEDLDPDKKPLEENPDKGEASKPLPPPSEVPGSEAGMSADHLQAHAGRAPAMSDRQGLLEGLKSADASHKAHMSKVVSLKRPASAAHSAAAMKRPASALPSAAKPASASAKGAEEPAAPRKTMNDEETMNLVYECVKLLEEETKEQPRKNPDMSVGKLVTSTREAVDALVYLANPLEI